MPQLQPRSRASDQGSATSALAAARLAPGPITRQLERMRKPVATSAMPGVAGVGAGHSFGEVPIHPGAAPARSDATHVRKNEHDMALDPAERRQVLDLVDKLDRESQTAVAPGPIHQEQHHRYPLTARIRRAQPALRSAEPGQADSPPGELVAEPEAAVFEAAGAATEGVELPEPAEGEAVQLPDIRLLEGEAIEQTDPIASVLGYNGPISMGGAAPSGFGVTRPYTHSLTSISVTPLAGTYFVSAVVDNPITFQVRASTGPASQVDIDSVGDTDITATNYPTVASDLTPDTSDLNGRPPRTAFWARDLTIVHERFHATEDAKWGLVGTVEAITWLNAQTASSVADVHTLLGRVPGRVAAKVRTEMAYPGREERAYDDGAPAYLARATLIQVRGAIGGYP